MFKFLTKILKWITVCIPVGILIYGLYLVFSNREIEFQILPNLF